jgi:N-acetylglutamate synthase-like GNAT family acetyltransferase
MAFKHHDDAIIPFNDTSCTTILDDGVTQCTQKHCKHLKTVCELADDPDYFKHCYCETCRQGLFENLLEKTHEMRQEKSACALETGKDYFIATGFQMCDGQWEYEHVNTKKKFLDNRSPVTEEIIQACGDCWLKREKEKKSHTVQTTLKDYFQNY